MDILKRLFGRREAVSEPAAVETLIVNAYATVRDLPPLDFPHELFGRRDLSDPELAPHLEGFIGYVMGRGDGQMTAVRYHLWRHLQRVRNHASFEVVPADLDDVEAWAHAANAVLFLPDGSVRAPDGKVVISAEGETDPAAVLPYPPDAVARRARTLDRLQGLEPKPPTGMPPAIGESELVLRRPDDVFRRALALLYVAAHVQAQATGGEAMEAGQPARNPVGLDALTPRETRQVRAVAADDAFAMTWRYEAANALFWALGVAPARIDESDRLVDVDALWRSVAPLARDGSASAGLRLRPAGEILDALDRAWREHWIVRQAREKDLRLDGLDGDVVAERHVALNWLTGFQNGHETAWDDIDTPT
ncbi:DUF4272 domain-containing protein [Methylobacterium sp. E-045]|uniref:DUF4272 domain-containing protein n=1 Tax=Methylobacterium sp. E-045 TaxID=2836575 RepID=UPI001FBAD278|nr:DUF4272 domain-containing protein [Methylobacterium sp. E-045]MCJ2131755.1 DUF4272 domain-containing protein [Methylobacterium sp. E-045]